MKLLDKIKKHLLLIVIMCAPLLAIIANSAYVFLSHSVARPNYISVAGIDSNNDGIIDKYFPTLESAIDEANNKKDSSDKIYLIPASEDNTCNTVYLFKDKTIDSNDSLILPFRRNGDGSFNDDSWNGRQSGENTDPEAEYESDTSGDTTKPFSGVNAKGFADHDETHVNFFRKLNLIIKSGVTLTIKGKLIVGGVLGREGQGLMGGTCGSYSQITLESSIDESDKTTIEFDNAEVTCYGYIKNTTNSNPNTLINSYSTTFYIPFVIYDYKGGSETGGLGNANRSQLKFKGVLDTVDQAPFVGPINIVNFTDPIDGKYVQLSPFTIMQSPNITVELCLNFKTNDINSNRIFGLVDLHTGYFSKNIISDYKFEVDQSHNTEELYLIGKDSISSNGVSINPIIQYNGQTQIFIKNNTEDVRYTNALYVDDTAYTTNRTKLTFVSNDDSLTKMNPMTMTLNVQIADATLSTSNMFFPVSFCYDVELLKGNFEIDCKCKFLPGSKLKVGEEAKLIFNEEAIFYSDKLYNAAEAVESNKFITGFNENPLVNSAYPKNLPSAILQVDGICNINKEFGGIILTSKEGAELNVNGDIGNYSLEGNGGFSQSGTTISFILNKKFVIEEKPRGYIGSPSTIDNFDKKTYFSEGDYWIQEVEETVIEFEPALTANPSEFGENGGKSTISLALNFKEDGVDVPISSLTNFSVKWASDPVLTPTTQTNTSASFTFPKNTVEASTNTYTITAQITCSYKGKSYSRNPATTVTVTKPASCITVNTLVNMADGTYKRAGDIQIGDIVLAYDHYTGRIVEAPIFINDDVNREQNGNLISYLKFDNGKEIGISYEHGFFDVDLNKYVYLTNNTAEDYIGHRFHSINPKTRELTITRLIDVETKFEDVVVCSPSTAYHLNILIEDTISMPGGLDGLFNIFEYDKGTLKFNEEKMTNDIETYGLFTYDDFKDYMSYDVYLTLPIPYLKVSIGKGLVTWEQLMGYVDAFVSDLENNLGDYNVINEIRIWKKDEYYY